VTQEWYFLDPKLALAELSVQLMFSILLEYIRMSSMNTTTNLSNSDVKTEFIRYMKCVATFVNPNDMIRYSYNPYLVVNAV
jgi:hypothetical protein